jgi:molybdate transport system substrate-binding protein
MIPAIAGAEPLLISAAASLTDVLQEIATEYQQSRGAAVTFNFGGSGTLQRQIEHGAPADVFIAAAIEPMDALEKQGLLLSDTRANVASNTLVLVAPAKSEIALHSFAELASPFVKQIAIGDPRTVPAGAYAVECFTTLGINKAVDPKLVRMLDVRQVLAAVELGNADAGLVYQTDLARRDSIRTIQVAPPNSHRPITYPVAALRRSKIPEGARAFIVFLQSDKARAAFQKYGFPLPK